MPQYDPASFFGPEAARRYDDQPRGDEADAARLLADLAGAGPALEFAIGTGRTALPLAAHGIAVCGIELSPHMVAQLRARPGGEDLPVTLGDMAHTQVDGKFRLVYLVYNTIFNLLTQDAQVACFQNAARHLTDDGAFLIEAAVPSAWIEPPSYVRPEWIAADGVGFDVARYDPVTQILDENHVRLTAEGISFSPIVCRLAWPAELDLMARLAGLTLCERWGGWHRQPFTADSLLHVSVYRAGDFSG
ncbi:MAG: class I SAM-dependent methyltransferase [Thermomicrobiales bacterium]|nr:class I SAM-dependent methyltransferase [Thermomicrobiales bacterium]